MGPEPKQAGLAGKAATSEQLFETICSVCNSHLSPPWPVTPNVPARTSLKVTSLVKRPLGLPEEGSWGETARSVQGPQGVATHLQIELLQSRSKPRGRGKSLNKAQPHKVINKGKSGPIHPAQKINSSECMQRPKSGISSPNGRHTQSLEAYKITGHVP